MINGPGRLGTVVKNISLVPANLAIRITRVSIVIFPRHPYLFKIVAFDSQMRFDPYTDAVAARQEFPVVIIVIHVYLAVSYPRHPLLAEG